MILTIYLIGCILSLLCNIYEVRKEGKLIVSDAIIRIVTIFLSFLYVIVVLCSELTDNWNTIIWEKK